MSASERTVAVATDNPQADILITDEHSAIVARGPSPLKKTLPLGIYGVKVKVGDEETPAMFRLSPGDGEMRVEVATPRFHSPIVGLHGGDDEALQSAAFAGYVMPAERLGAGAKLRLVVRDPRGSAERCTPDAYMSALAQFCLLDRDGEAIYEFGDNAGVAAVGRCLVWIGEVDPGAYFLCVRNTVSAVCVSLWATTGSSLCCHIDLVPSGIQGGALRPDLRGMAMSYHPGDQEPDPAVQRIGESIRIGMSEGRTYAHTTWLKDVIEDGHVDPMIGLYAAHLLLADALLDSLALKHAIMASEALLGADHPDIIALWCGYGRRAGLAAPSLDGLKGLPMLARGWDLLLAAIRQTSTPERYGALIDKATNVASDTFYLSCVRPSPSRASRPQAPTGVFAGPLGWLSGAAIGGVVDALVDASERLGHFPLGSLASQSLRDLELKYSATAETAKPASPEDLADRLRSLARSSNWKDILKYIMRKPDVARTLHGLPLDLVRMLRDASGDEFALEGITPAYVQTILDRTRTQTAQLASTLETVASLARIVSSLKHAAKPQVPRA